MNHTDIARTCHEVNRAYCQALGDMSQPAWEDAPQWQKDSAMLGVKLHAENNVGPETSHISWMNQKLAEGWKYGAFKDAEKSCTPASCPSASCHPSSRPRTSSSAPSSTPYESQHPSDPTSPRAQAPFEPR